MKRETGTNRNRNQKGNVLVLILVVTCLILLPLLLMLSHAGLFVMDRDRVQSAVDAAGLIAANDLSRIIINDSNFGYVSLSNYPPIGKATCAEDGEPLPVTGINTLVGTIRQNTIVAEQLGNATMRHLVDSDRNALGETIKDLNNALSKSLSGEESFNDIHGKKIDTLKDVTAFLSSHLPDNVRLESVKLTSGWLQGGGTTTIPVPQPVQFSDMKPGDWQGGDYKAFVDIPAGGKSFSFAGLAASSRLVNNAAFRPADLKHINSIVRLECVVGRKNPYLPFLPAPDDPSTRLKCVAYSQPYSMPDIGPKGVMTLRFRGQPVPGMQSWSDFLNGAHFQDHGVTTYDVIGGDYPKDKDSRMVPSESEDMEPTTSQQFAEHFYYWLRNGHVQPRIDAVLNMVSAQFQSAPNEIYIYEFAKNGGISRRTLARDPFPVGTTADSQYSSMADTSIQGGLTPIIIFRDNVKNLGTENGGKHAGQPLAGSPLNWCELREFGGDEATAQDLGKGRSGTQLTVTNPDAPAPSADEIANSSIARLFRNKDGKDLELQPRRSFYSGGLALDIEIGGIRKVPPPTLDIPSKRRFLIGRKV